MELTRKYIETRSTRCPRIINVRFEEGKIELQMIEFSSLKLQEISDERISQLLGNDIKLEKSTSSKLRSDQAQLLSAILLYRCCLE